jgi:thiol:disulfide interchange protein
MMTMLVAMLGLLPAATSHGIGSDSQRPFAIVIVGGLMAALLMSIFLLPTLYVWIFQSSAARPQGHDRFWCSAATDFRQRKRRLRSSISAAIETDVNQPNSLFC